MKILLSLILARTFATAVNAGDAPQVPPDNAQSQTEDYKKGYNTGVEYKETTEKLTALSDVLVTEMRAKYDNDMSTAARDPEFSLRVFKIQQDTRAYKAKAEEVLNACVDERAKSEFKSGFKDGHASIAKPATPVAKADSNDKIKTAREKGHDIGLEMVASEKKAKELMNDAVEAERDGSTTRLRLIRSEINKLLSEKAAREKPALEYVGGLTPAERDAYVEGIQAAQAGKK